MRIFLCFLILLNTCMDAEIMDLEEALCQDFITETKKISVPGFPYAFNPSIVRYQGLLLMSFRAGKNYLYNDDQGHHIDCHRYSNTKTDQSYSPNRIGLIWLDEHFNPASAPQLLDVENRNITYRQQDPRLLVVGEKLYIAYSDIVKGVLIPETKRMFIAEVTFNGKHFHVGDTECLSEFEGIQDHRWEKNWVPFVYEDEMMLAYSINPHKIFFPLLNGTGVCCTKASTKKTLNWKWGDIRGGTTALLENKDEYLAFFHSSTVIASQQSDGKKMQHYFMGAYTFSSQPPFELKRISSEPIVGKNFYNGPKYTTWKPLLVVFPCGFVSDEEAVYVAYGRQDHEIWIAKFDKEGLFNSMVSIE